MVCLVTVIWAGMTKDVFPAPMEEVSRPSGHMGALLSIFCIELGKIPIAPNISKTK